MKHGIILLSLQEGVSAVYLASSEGHVAAVKLLLEKGPDLSLCDEVYDILYPFIHVLSAVPFSHSSQPFTGSCI